MADYPVIPPWERDREVGPAPVLAPPWEQPVVAAPPLDVPPMAEQPPMGDVPVVAEPENQAIDPFPEPLPPGQDPPQPVGAFAVDVGDTQLAPTNALGFEPPVAPPSQRSLAVDEDLDVDTELKPAESLSPAERDAAPGTEAVELGDLNEEGLLERRIEEVRRNEHEAEFDRKMQRQKLAEEEERIALEQEGHRQKLMELQADMETARKTKVDPARSFKNKSTGQHIAGFIAAVIGGWLQGKRGGKGGNPMLEALEREVAQDIALQQQEIVNTRTGLQAEIGLVGQLMAQGVTEKRAAYIAYDRAMGDIDQQLANEQAKLAPGGTSAIGIEQMRRAIAAKREAAQQAAVVAMRKEVREDTDYKIKMRQEERAHQAHILDSRNKALDIAKKEKKLRGGGSGVGRGKGTSRDKPRIIGNPKAKYKLAGMMIKGEYVQLNFDNQKAWEDAKVSKNALQRARQFRARIMELGNVTREIEVKGIRGKKAEQMRQAALQAAIHVAKSFGGTITDADLQAAIDLVTGGNITRILQNVDATRAAIDNFVGMQENNLAVAMSDIPGARGAVVDRLPSEQGPKPYSIDEGLSKLSQDEVLGPDGKPQKRDAKRLAAEVNQLVRNVTDETAEDVYRKLGDLEANAPSARLRAAAKRAKVEIWRNHLSVENAGVRGRDQFKEGFRNIAGTGTIDRLRDDALGKPLIKGPHEAVLEQRGILPPWERDAPPAPVAPDYGPVVKPGSR